MLPVFYLILRIDFQQLLSPFELKMRKLLVIALLSVLLLESCSHGLTPFEAASGKQKCGRGYVK